MKTLCAFLLLCGFAFGQSEILRPTADSDPGSSTWVTANCTIGTYVHNGTSGTLARDDLGQSTAMTFSYSNGIAANKNTARIFFTWASTANSYSALTLNVNAKAVSRDGVSKIVYSTDNGSTWTALVTPQSTQTTTTISLSATQNLSQLRVGICLSATGFDPGTATETVNLYDIWTSGSLVSAAAVGTGSSSGTAALGAITSQ